MDYQSFLATKRKVAESVGFEPVRSLNAKLFPWQADVVRWALRRGRAAIFAGCGLGKTPMQLEWAQHVHEQTNRPVLILTPLAVAQQTIREGRKFGIDVNLCRTQADVRQSINVTNYEKLHHFDPTGFSGIVLDESGILKSFEGVTRKLVTDFARVIPFRLACTATPAPNDFIELTNHAEFLDIMTGKEILATFFIQDGNTANKWRLKGHARDPFWRWLASWAVAVRSPSDLGYPDDGYILPPLNVHEIIVPSRPSDGYLLPMEARGLSEQRAARRDSLDERVKACVEIATSTQDPFLCWCDLNKESEALAKLIPGAVEIRGNHSDDYRERAMLGFTDGSIRVLVSKPTICGYGLNWQHCSRAAFVGLSNSHEQVYQATRRIYRFGQPNPVDCYHIVSEAELVVIENLKRKEHQADEMFSEIVKHMKGFSLGRAGRDEMEYWPTVEMRVPSWLYGSGGRVVS